MCVCVICIHITHTHTQERERERPLIGAMADKDVMHTGLAGMVIRKGHALSKELNL